MYVQENIPDHSGMAGNLNRLHLNRIKEKMRAKKSVCGIWEEFYLPYIICGWSDMQMNSSYLNLTVIFVLLRLENISDHLFSYQRHFFITYYAKRKKKKRSTSSRLRTCDLECVSRTTYHYTKLSSSMFVKYAHYELHLCFSHFTIDFHYCTRQ